MFPVHDIVNLILKLTLKQTVFTDMAKRNKKIQKAHMDKVLSHNWEPVKLKKSDIPTIAGNLLDSKVHSIYASGSIDLANPERDGRTTTQGQIGGIDVYRHAEEKDGVKINKDWYRVLNDENSDEEYIVVGPYGGAEHWIDEIPERLKDATDLSNSGQPPQI